MGQNDVLALSFGWCRFGSTVRIAMVHAKRAHVEHEGA